MAAIEDDQATSLNDLPGGPPMTVAGAPPQRSPDPGNQAAVHDIMAEMEARRSAETHVQMPPMDQQPQMMAMPPPNAVLMGDDPYAGGYTQHLHSDTAQQHAMDGQKAKAGLMSLFSGPVLETLKEPALVAVLGFLIHQEFFGNLVLSVLPGVLKQFAQPGSASLVPSIIKAVILGLAFLLFRRML